MKKVFKYIALIAFLSSSAFCDDLDKSEGVTTIREGLGDMAPLEHADAQIRVGYISLDNKNSTIDQKAFALGGHLHLSTKGYKGIKAHLELYSVEDMGMTSSDADKIEPTFFNADKEGFALLTQAYIEAKFKDNEIRVGRQMIDTPYADSDDIRMMPNYFLAYTLTNHSIDKLTIFAGKIDQMSGWENGVDASKFVNVSLSYGATKKSDGIYFVSTIYELAEDSLIQAWYYHIDNIAKLVYLEAASEFFTNISHTVVGLQFERAVGSNEKLLNEVDSLVSGVSVSSRFIDSGLLIYAAYNRSLGQTGAFSSLGGGPFFTSLEDQTLDAIGEKGEAWTLSAMYSFSNIGIDRLNGSISFGSYKADNSQNYHKSETDISFMYDISKKLDITFAYAAIDDKTSSNQDYNQLRVIANYNFNSLIY